ncbi:MAG: glycoside hydrolase family 32 protein, partial [Lachnospiraceae bacterium]|nr:glycoside hydrolase family 32 protein [Lachnospiraceae bacterium]
MKYNGFSTYRREHFGTVPIENFTLSFLLTPYTYESCYSGVISGLSREKKTGMEVLIGKGGRVLVRVGLGNDILELESLREHLQYQQENQVSIGFWGDAGWCDLVINGKLSMRKQFARHGRFYPEETYVLGRWEHPDLDPRKGFFHGEFSELVFAQQYIHYDEVIRQQMERLDASATSVSQEGAAQNVGSHDRSSVFKDADGIMGKTGIDRVDLYEGVDLSEDPYHPVFHLCPPAKWMNEPHAPFFYDGWYHIFYQANPHGPIWDNICWGHLISRDMVDWQYAGIAISPDSERENPIDPDGIWSGSACISKEGVPLLFYTAGNNGQLPNQSVALAKPADLREKGLLHWEKMGVLQKQPEDVGFLGEFRDPFVFLRNGRYYMLVGCGDRYNGGGNACVFAGNDLHTLEYQGFLMDYTYEKSPEVGHVWELPVLLPLFDETGAKQCDILLLCTCQVETRRVETAYFLGDFDEKSCKFIRRRELPGFLDLGGCVFTGPSGMVTKDKRSILFTIAQGRRDPEEEFNSGWAHNGGMPVELSMQQGAVRIRPIRELEQYFTQVVYEGREAEKLADFCLLEHAVELTAEGDVLELLLEAGEEGTIVRYCREDGVFSARMRGEEKPFSVFRGDVDRVNIGDEPISVKILVDHSLVEIYLNEKKSMSLRSYAYQDGYRLKLLQAEEAAVRVR